jgi:hypothetical protein
LGGHVAGGCVIGNDLHEMCRSCDNSCFLGFSENSKKCVFRVFQVFDVTEIYPPSIRYFLIWWMMIDEPEIVVGKPEIVFLGSKNDIPTH